MEFDDIIAKECDILKKNCRGHGMDRIRIKGPWIRTFWNSTFLFLVKSQHMIFVDLIRRNVTRNFMFFVIKYLLGTKSTKSHQKPGSQRSNCTASITKVLHSQIRRNYCILGSRLHVQLREGRVRIRNTPIMKRMTRAFQKCNGHF